MSYLLDLAAAAAEVLAIYGCLLLVAFLWIRRHP